MALFVGIAPLRICAHAQAEHARVWVPGAEAFESVHPEHDHDGCCAHGHEHADGSHEGADCPLGHEPGCPDCPMGGHCHCSDSPLVSSTALAPVVLCPHALVDGAEVAVSSLSSRGVPEVAPSYPGGRRRACEEDPIVLLR